MGSGTLFALAVGVLIVLIAARIPVGFSLAAAGTFGLVMLQGVDLASSSLANRPYSSLSSYSYILIPMFMLMSMFIVQSNLVEELFSVARRALRWLPGGLGLAAVAGCAGFAAVTGSSVATVATMGRVAIDQMRSQGYSGSFAAGIVACTGTLGILIPPSLVLVLYGILAGESVGMMLLAGVIPGVLSAGIYSIVVLVWARLGGVAEPVEAIEARASASTIPWRSIVAMVQLASLALIVVGGIYTGIFTATESGAVAAFVAFVLMLAIGGRGLATRFQLFREALKETSSVVGMVFMLLIGGSLFSLFMVTAGIPRSFASWISELDYSPTLVLLLLLLALVPLGMFLDGLSILLIVVPLVAPTLEAFGVNGIWFGILLVKMIEFGLITPPLGINVYVVAGTSAELTVEESFRGVWPFALADLFTVALLVAVPALVLWLPERAAI